jgi:hypothetical protein
MKFLLPAMAIFASTALAAKYEAGTICHTNIECENNCLDKQYTIVNEDGGYVFVCDPGVADPLQWYNAICKSGQNDRFEKGTTEAMCKTNGGQFCKYTCVLSGKRSVDGDNRDKWYDACGLDQSGIPTYLEIHVEKDEESAKGFC